MDFRFDYLRLAEEDFPTENLVNGTTCYFVDTGDFYIYYNDEWYNQNFDSSSANSEDEGGVE